MSLLYAAKLRCFPRDRGGCRREVVVDDGGGCGTVELLCEGEN